MSFIYHPSPWQQQFHNLPHHEALGAGAAGVGKTACLIMEPLAQIVTEHKRAFPGQFPGEKIEHPIEPGSSTGWALYLRRLGTTLDQIIARAHRQYKLIDPGCQWRAQKNWFEFSSGYKVQFGHCKDIYDWMHYYSNEYTFVVYDELVEFEEEQYEQINSRLRSSDPVLSEMLKIRAMSNPVTNLKIKDPNWVRKRFVDPAPQGKTTIRKKLVMSNGETKYRTRIYWPGKLSDNPDKAFAQQYEETLRDKPQHMRRALLDGDWNVVPDSFFGEEWRPELHICRPFRIPSDWPQFRSMDWGYKAFGVIYWCALSPDDVLYVHKEHSFRKREAGVVAKDVKEIEEDLHLWHVNRSGITGPADNQLWEERGNSGKTMAAEFSDAGVYWTKADKRSRKRNAAHLMKRLKDHNHGTTPPGIVFFDTCKRGIQTIPNIMTDPNDLECPADGGDDHWLDAILYGCAFASNGAAGIPRRRQEDEMDEPIVERGKFGYGLF